MGIFARHNSEWYRVDGEHGGPIGGGELPGLGGWATITDVKGRGNKYSYNDGSMDWVAFEWTQDGQITTSGGIADALVVAAGGPSYATGAPQLAGGGAGGLFYGMIYLGNKPEDIVVGQAPDLTTTPGDSSISRYGVRRGAMGTGGSGQFDGRWGGSGSGGSGTGKVGGEGIVGQGYGGGAVTTGFAAGGGAGGPASGSTPGVGVELNYRNGTPELYAQGGANTNAPTRPNSGDAGRSTATVKGQSGVVIVRVPKANYTGNLPDGAFDIPTTRQAIVEAVEEKVESVKDTMIIDGRETKIKRNRKR